MELDVYVEGAMVAFEAQGYQHYQFHYVYGTPTSLRVSNLLSVSLSRIESMDNRGYDAYVEILSIYYLSLS